MPTLAQLNSTVETITERFSSQINFIQHVQIEENRKLKVFTLELRDRLDTLQRDYRDTSYELNHEIADLRAYIWEIRSAFWSLRDQVDSLNEKIQSLSESIPERKRKLVDRPGGRFTETETDLTSVSSGLTEVAEQGSTREEPVPDTLLETFTPTESENS
jgi:chromosome segregation ATPase